MNRRWESGDAASVEATYMQARPGFDDATWQGVEPIDLVEVLTGDRPNWPTAVTVGRTDTELWVLFRCRASSVQATMTRYKDKVWQEGAVEVYLRPPTDPFLYEFQLNAIGTARDLRVGRAGEEDQDFDDSWSCLGMVTASAIERGPDRNITGWRALFGFPWEAFPYREAISDGWEIGLFRIERQPLEFSGVRWCSSQSLELHDPRLMAPLRLRAEDHTTTD